MAIEGQLENENPLQQVNFKFVIEKSPKMAYMGISGNLPGITIGEVDQITPFVTQPWPGDSFEFENLDITFIVDEDMKNWLEIWNWIISAVQVEDFDDVRDAEDIFSDITLTITNNRFNPNLQFFFRDCFPISLGGLDFTTQDTDVEAVTSNVGFRYRNFKPTEVV